MMSALSNLRSLLRQNYKNAFSRTFIPFPEGSAAATPLNAVPFYVSISDLRADWQWSQRRKYLLDRFESFIDIVSNNVVPVYGLMGGSFIDRSCDSPNDLDIVIFYTNKSDALADVIENQKLGKSKYSVDCRFIPLDVDPLLSLRAASFFSVLYSIGANPKKSAKDTLEKARAPLFVDLQLNTKDVE